MKKENEIDDIRMFFVFLAQKGFWMFNEEITVHLLWIYS